MQNVEVEAKDARNLFVALGIPQAANWSEELADGSLALARSGL